METDPLQLERAAAETFEQLADRWRLTAEERLRWLGKDLDPAPSAEEKLDRVSYALGIYRALHIIFSEPELADSWMRRNNEYFGCSALTHALSGGADAMRDVREHLEGQLLH